VTNISQSLPHIMAGKQLAQIMVWRNYITVTLRISPVAVLDFDFGGHYVAHYSIRELWQDINVLLLHSFPWNVMVVHIQLLTFRSSTEDQAVEWWCGPWPPTEPPLVMTHWLPARCSSIYVAVPAGVGVAATVVATADTRTIVNKHFKINLVEYQA